MVLSRFWVILDREGSVSIWQSDEAIRTSREGKDVRELGVLGSHRALAVVLVLVGGLVGLVFAVCSLALIPFMAGVLDYGFGMTWQYGEVMGKYGMFGYPQVDLRIIAVVMLAWTMIMFMGATLSIYCGFRLRQDNEKNAAFFGIIGGLLLLLTFSWLPALLVLVGSALAYTA